MNGTYLGESRFDGKTPHTLELALPSGVLKEGANELAIENVGDTDAPYSMVMLDAFEVTYAATPILVDGALEARVSEAGTLRIHGAHFATLQPRTCEQNVVVDQREGAGRTGNTGDEFAGIAAVDLRRHLAGRRALRRDPVHSLRNSR